MTKGTWTWISAVAAMLTSSGAAVRAQDAPAPPMPPASGMDTTSTTTSTTTTGTMTDGMTSSMDSASMHTVPSDRPDYRVLISPEFDYQDLKQAEAVGLGDDEVARIALISRMSGVPFRDIRDAVMRGETFSSLADQYNLNLSDLDDVSDEKLSIAAFESAYEATGLSGLKRTASAQDVELQSSFERFRQLNANFPATATPSTLVFDRGTPPVTTAVETTTETTTTVRAALPAPVEKVETVHTTTVRRVRTVTRVNHVRHYRHHAVRVRRHHQYHHHMPSYMNHGS